MSVVKMIVEVEEGGIVTKSGMLDDGTPVMFCNPHHKWEWDCECGHVNGTRDTSCNDCGKERS